MSGGVTTRDFGTREDAAITDLEEAGPGATLDTHTLMGLTKGQVQRLGEMLDAIDLLALSEKQADLSPSTAAEVTAVASAKGAYPPAFSVRASRSVSKGRMLL